MMSNKIYAVSYGYDDIGIGYFETEEEAREYCDLMNNVGREGGDYTYEEFELLNLDEIKQNMKTYIKASIVVRIKHGIFTWDISDFEKHGTTGNAEDDEYSYKTFGSNIYIAIKLNYTDENEARDKVVDLISRIQNRYVQHNLLERAVSEVLAIYNIK